MSISSQCIERRKAALNATRGKGHEVLGAFHTIPPYGGDPIQDRPMMNTAGCGFCFKVGEYENFTLLKCKKCQRAYYCSRETRPDHRRLCQHWDEEDQKVIKMAWRVHHYPAFTALIEREIGQRYLVEFADSQELDSRQVRMVDISVYFLPTSDEYYPQQGKLLPDRNMRARFQIYSIKKRKIPPPSTSSSEFDKVRRLWAVHRQAADRAGFQLYPIFLVQYRYNNQPILISSAVFTPQSFNALRDVGPTTMVFPAAKSIVKDLLPSGVREVNQIIQRDKENQLGLIKWMSELDKTMTPELHMSAITYHRHLFRDRSVREDDD